MLHISDIKKYKRCPRLYHLSKGQMMPYQPYLRHDEELMSLVIAYMGIGEHFAGQRGDDPKRVLAELDNYEWFVKARFAYDDLRIKVPLLQRTKDGYHLYFVTYAPFPNDNDLEFYHDTLWVLAQNGVVPTAIDVIHLNGEYVRGEQLEIDKLFRISDHLYRQTKPTIYLNDLLEHRRDPRPIMDAMREGSLEDHGPIKKRACKVRNICRFYDDCFPEILPDDDIEFLVSSQHKSTMQEAGTKYLRDADLSLLEGTRVQYAQIQADRNGGRYVDKLALTHWLKKFEGKEIAFIDFEWDTYIIPPYRGLRPYDHLPFQYSLHIMRRDGSITRRDYIATGDSREGFIRSLIKDVPKDAYLMAYNANAAEIMRLNELAEQFPQYATFLQDIADRTFDLAYPFGEGIIYDIKMRGHFSVKSLLSVVSDRSYSEIAISNGMDAVDKWRLLDRHDESVDLKEVQDKLLEYCALDSYSLYLIYMWLLELVH